MSKMINDLMNPDAFPEKTERVSLVQTHISNVFITDCFVYKIKKPVNFGFLDFSTLPKRKYYCTQEIELNNRLSSDVYLGVLPVTFDGRSHKIGNQKGEVIDYAVQMRRLPDGALMKCRFNNGTLSPKDIEKTVKVIAEFHKGAESSEEIGAFGKPNVIKFSTDENFQQTKEFIGISIDKNQYHSLKDWTDSFYENSTDLFIQRIRDKKIRDCHGDLHMEHVCLTEPITIFDCIEFNDRFRYVDTASDLTFLLMDLEFNGGPELSEILYKAYLTYSGESDIDLLIRFYKIYRAYVRGKVNSFQLNDPNIDETRKAKAVETAQRYFALACSYIR